MMRMNFGAIKNLFSELFTRVKMKLCTIKNFFSGLFTKVKIWFLRHNHTELNRWLLDAAKRGDTAAVSALITAGANVNTANSEGETALMLAAQFGYIATVTALLAAPGILLNQVDQDGNTALIHAERNHDNQTFVIAALLAVPNILVNHANRYGKTALKMAADNSHTRIVIALLAAPGIDVNATDLQGGTPLFMPSRNGDTAIVTALLAAPGILVNHASHGWTPLMVAAYHGHIANVTAFLAAPGIDVNWADQHGVNAITNAFENGHHDIVTLLQARGAVLPARLRQAGININRGQSVHEVSVHLSVSRSAKNLLDQYLFTPKKIISTINELSAWLNTDFANSAELPREYKAEWLEPAKRCVANLNILDFTDQRSGVTMQQALALVWAGINNPHANGNDKPTLSTDEIIDRRISFIKQLYEIQRGYNLSESANPIDYGGADDNTCVSGSFNKLIAALSDAGHQGVQIIFVTSALIHMQVPFLTKQAFNGLSEEHRTRFAQNWENENSEALQAECFGMLKNLVSAKLHEVYDDFDAEVPNLNQVITDAATNVEHTEMDTVMNQEREMIQKKEQDTQAERERQTAAAIAIAPMPAVRQQRAAVVFSCHTRGMKRSRVEAVNAPEPEEAAAVAPVGRYPKRSTRSFRGSYKE
jgi:ankyrin repeat protein